jgi:hypothetical protein
MYGTKPDANAGKRIGYLNPMLMPVKGLGTKPDANVRKATLSESAKTMKC